MIDDFMLFDCLKFVALIKLIKAPPRRGTKMFKTKKTQLTIEFRFLIDSGMIVSLMTNGISIEIL